MAITTGSDMDSYVSSGDSSSGSEEGEWLDAEPDQEPLAVVSLFDCKTFSSLDEMLSYCQEHHSFDLRATICRLHLDFIGAVKLVNFVRDCVSRGQRLPPIISRADIDKEAYLKPVLENDAALFSLGDIMEITDAPNLHGDNNTLSLSSRNSRLEAELKFVQASFANYRLAVQQTLDRRWGDDQEEPRAPRNAAPTKNCSDYYFESYASNDIHETMLKDCVRTDAYRDFIYNNKHLFQGRIVLDIGCGTGILSMFCAKAGASQVIAVDKSDIIDKARENVFNNGLSDVITCLRGAIEDVNLPVQKVDIIISEWMGYCLLYEAMLPSVLYARDKYLKAGGLLVPSSATMWIAPIEDPTYVAEHVSYWRNVYGFDMKAMQEGIYDDARIETIPINSICGSAFPFRTLDLRSVRAEDLVFTADWDSDLDRTINGLDGFAIWFDNFFATSDDEPMPAPATIPDDWVKRKRGNVAFTTGPAGTETHWKQGLLLVKPQPSQCVVPASARVSGSITFAIPEENARALMMDASWAIAGQQRRSQSWKLK